MGFLAFFLSRGDFHWKIQQHSCSVVGGARCVHRGSNFTSLLSCMEARTMLRRVRELLSASGGRLGTIPEVYIVASTHFGVMVLFPCHLPGMGRSRRLENRGWGFPAEFVLRLYEVPSSPFGQENRHCPRPARDFGVEWIRIWQTPPISDGPSSGEKGLSIM